MVSICLFNSPPQYCLLSRWFFPDPKTVLWVSNNPSDSLLCSQWKLPSYQRSRLRTPLPPLLAAFHDVDCSSTATKESFFRAPIMFRSQVPYLPDLVDLAAPLPNDRSNHVVGDRHLMPGFWFSIQRHQKNWIFYERQHLCSFCSKDKSDLRSRSLLSSLLDLPPPPPVDLRAKSAIASNGELRSRRWYMCLS